MKMTNDQRNLIANLLMQIALDITACVINNDDKNGSFSNKIQNNVFEKIRIIESIFGKESESTCNKNQENPSESIMERDDRHFKKGYEIGFDDGRRNAQDSRGDYETAFNKGFKEGLYQSGLENKNALNAERKACFDAGFKKGVENKLEENVKEEAIANEKALKQAFDAGKAECYNIMKWKVAEAYNRGKNQSKMEYKLNSSDKKIYENGFQDGKKQATKTLFNRGFYQGWDECRKAIAKLLESKKSKNLTKAQIAKDIQKDNFRTKIIS